MAHRPAAMEGGRTAAGRTPMRRGSGTGSRDAVSGRTTAARRVLVFGAASRGNAKGRRKRPQRRQAAVRTAPILGTVVAKPALSRRVNALRKQNGELKRALRALRLQLKTANVSRLLADNDALRTENRRLMTEIRSLRSGGATDSRRREPESRDTAAGQGSVSRRTSGPSSQSPFTSLWSSPRRGIGTRRRAPSTVPGDPAVSALPGSGTFPGKAQDASDDGQEDPRQDRQDTQAEDWTADRPEQPEGRADHPESQADWQSAPPSVYDALFPESGTTPEVVPDPTVWDVVYSSVPTNYTIPDADFAAFLAASLEDDAVPQSDAS